ncbi:MAG: response regulator receiver modulated CheB methylesterase [Lachnospiraceae bacterium]|jgi:two-component system chemotaxis response regulator CheB|nr:response regulator receiver modulated CheB methylesterase [Lachnospiraceae bacterium]
MQKKVLIVDDSALMRRVLSDIINSDERFHVTKLATNGLEALNLLIQDKEEMDAIILDINMPKMGGLDFLKRLEQENLKVIVIVVSTIAKDGAKETIDALEHGAFDFVTKPENFMDVKNDRFKNNILNCLSLALKLSPATYQSAVVSTSQVTPKLIKEHKREQIQEPGKEQTKEPMVQLQRTKRDNQKKLVAIACSTGGPKALQRIIPFLPEKLGCSVLIVQHMPVGFTASLANRLNELSKIQVQEAVDGEILRDDVVYIAKGGNQMRIESQGGNNRITLTSEPARNGLRPCADIMYESLAGLDYDEITCVVLTGMGSDGTQGIKRLKEKNNIYVIAQEETSCTVYGMPKVVVDNGLANEIITLDKVASAITKNSGVH